MKSMLFRAVLCAMLLGLTSHLFAQQVDVYSRPLQYQKTRDYNALHYRIQLRFDEQKQMLYGENIVTVAALRDGFDRCELDGTFPNHLPDPTVPKYVKDLIAKVKEHNADAGIGFDGDSDRVGVIDNLGRMIYADKLLAMFAADTLTREPGSDIVFDVKCSQALPEMIKKSGGKPFMWKTGHSILKAKMKELHSPLAGEMSGHIFINDGYFGYDDGIFSAGRLLQILANSGKTLAELHDEIPAFESTPEIRVECTDEEKFDIVDELVAAFKKEYEVIDVDGARVQFGDGWGLVRASNTQPVLVLRFEAKSDARLREIVAIFKNELDRYSSVKYSKDDFYGY